MSQFSLRLPRGHAFIPSFETRPVSGHSPAPPSGAIQYIFCSVSATRLAPQTCEALLSTALIHTKPAPRPRARDLRHRSAEGTPDGLSPEAGRFKKEGRRAETRRPSSVLAKNADDKEETYRVLQSPFILRHSSFRNLFPARAAVRAALSVERAALRAAVVHRAREPVGDEGADGEDADQHEDAEECVLQPLCLSSSSPW